MVEVDYVRRVVDSDLDELLPALSAIALEGPKGVGKTATASRRADVTFRLDDPAQLAVISADSNLLDGTPGTVLIDELATAPAGLGPRASSRRRRSPTRPVPSHRKRHPACALAHSGAGPHRPGPNAAPQPVRRGLDRTDRVPASTLHGHPDT